MTAVLIALAITVPPSAAAVLVYWLGLQKQLAVKLNESSNELLTFTAQRVDTHRDILEELRITQASHERQISNLTDKVLQ